MPFEVLLTAGAERDLQSIYEHILRADGRLKAERVLDRLLEIGGGLADLPERGNHPKELLALGIRDYREARFKPYRIFYRVDGRKVFIMLIADGRRDMRSLLERRLLGPG